MYAWLGRSVYRLRRWVLAATGLFHDGILGGGHDLLLLVRNDRLTLDDPAFAGGVEQAVAALRPSWSRSRSATQTRGLPRSSTASRRWTASPV